MNSADILVSNGIILTLDNKNSQIKNGSVAIKKDKIVAVGNADEFAAWEVSKIVDANDCIIMPGLVNTHTHAAMVAFRGLADDLPLMTWLNDYIFPAESKLDEEKVYRATLPFLICEFLLSKVRTIPFETSISAEFIVLNILHNFAYYFIKIRNSFLCNLNDFLNCCRNRVVRIVHIGYC